MTKNYSGSLHFTESIEEYIESATERFHSLVDSARVNREVDEVNYRRLYSEDCNETEFYEAYSHFDRMYAELIRIIKDSKRRVLLERIEKGTDFMDTCDKNDPKYPGYVKAYDDLFEQMNELGW